MPEEINGTLMIRPTARELPNREMVVTVALDNQSKYEPNTTDLIKKLKNFFTKYHRAGTSVGVVSGGSSESDPDVKKGLVPENLSDVVDIWIHIHIPEEVHDFISVTIHVHMGEGMWCTGRQSVPPNGVYDYISDYIRGYYNIPREIVIS